MSHARAIALAGLALFAAAAVGLGPRRERFARAGLTGPEGDRGTTAARAAAPPARSGAATAPAADPNEVLAAACRRQAEALRRRLDRGFSLVVRPPFVVAGNLPQDRLESLSAGSVVRPAEAMWKAYFRRRPTEVITVLLLADERSYRRWADRLFADKDVPYFGYYKGDPRTLVMNIATGTGTLVHELTHALIVWDFPDVPTWFNEGLASLHEQCQVGRDDVVGLVNWRLPGLQQAIRAGRLRPLRDLLTRDDFRGAQQGLNYAQARYFVMFMQQQGVLKKFYAHFRENHDGPEAGVKAAEAIFGRGFDGVEKDFLAWVGGLKFPPD